MFINFEKYIDYHIIEVNFNDESNLLLITLNNGYIFKLEACGECCSISYFHKYKKEIKDISFLIQKTIKNIKIVHLSEEEINEITIEENIKINDVWNEYVQPYVYEISFLNSNDNFKFMMLNYSNGYYSGWIEGTVIKN